MNENERQILQKLRENAREKLTCISKETQIPVSTIFDKIRSFEGNLIRKFTALLSFDKLGLYTALIAVKVHPEEKADFLAHVKSNAKVNNLLRINNGFDYLFEMVFSSMRGLEEFIETLESKFRLKKKEVYYVLDDIKRETYMTEGALAVGMEE